MVEIVKNLIFLYGPSGSGKSTVGKKLADTLLFPFVDLDDEITKSTGKTILEIFEDEGEEGFRKYEKEELTRITNKYNNGVFSLGGGSLLDEDNRDLAESFGQVILLQANAETLAARLKESETERPLLANNLQEQLTQLLKERKEHYASFEIRIETDELTIDEVVRQVELVSGYISIKAMKEEYWAWIQPGGLNALESWVAMFGLGTPVVVVTDENVGGYYADQVMENLKDHETRLVTFPAGEKHKNRETLSLLWDKLEEAGIERSSTIIALGGGVVGDITGFAAATYLRGVQWVNIPTSLLAMVDASLGGKTGIDLPHGKNLAGAFYPPRAVLTDPDTLATLPEEELRSGMAEVVKHGVIADLDLFDLCSRGWDAVTADLPNLVRQAVAVKVGFIEDDPYEKGRRAALNYGHTIGHAIEAASYYQLRHGEAVAIGMVIEAKLAEEIGLAKKGLAHKISQTLESLGLPTDIPNKLEPEHWMSYLYVDKKRANGKVHFSLPIQIGEIKTRVMIDNLEERILSVL